MATALPHRVHYTYAEYLALEAESNVKHEYLHGQIYAMAGGSPEHAALQAALTGLLFAQLAGKPCRVHSSDLHVRVPATGLATYPDVTVICGKAERDPASENTVVNPTVICEVLSHSTEDYDRTEKFEHYQQIASLQEYVLVSPRERVVEVWTRDGAAWSRAIAREDGVAAIASVGCRVAVRDLFERAFAGA